MVCVRVCVCVFSSIEYVGIQTLGGKSTDFSELKATVTAILENNKIRSPRRLTAVFTALKVSAVIVLWIRLDGGLLLSCRR